METFRIFVRSLALLPLLGLGSCFSFERHVIQSPSPPPASGRTVIVPPGSTVTCVPQPCQIQ